VSGGERVPYDGGAVVVASRAGGAAGTSAAVVESGRLPERGAGRSPLAGAGRSRGGGGLSHGRRACPVSSVAGIELRKAAGARCREESVRLSPHVFDREWVYV
jgi:hypothetical protein